MRGLTDAIQLRCDMSASSAQRTAYALTSILTSSARLKRAGPLVEIA